MNKQNKIFVASLIREKKDILFGKFSNVLTNNTKVIEWQKIFENIKSHGILIEKDWKYLRDVVWQNLRRITVTKVDNSKKTGAAGGTQAKLTDLDNIIIDIIGKDSPTVEGIVDEDDSLEKAFVGADESKKPPQTQAPKPSRKRRAQQQRDDEDIIVSLRKRRLELEIYNLQLDALKKEKEMGLPRSHLTTEIDNDNGKSNECRESESESENENETIIQFHNM